MLTKVLQNVHFSSAREGNLTREFTVTNETSNAQRVLELDCASRCEAGHEALLIGADVETGSSEIRQVQFSSQYVQCVEIARRLRRVAEQL